MSSNETTDDNRDSLIVIIANAIEYHEGELTQKQKEVIVKALQTLTNEKITEEEVSNLVSEMLETNLRLIRKVKFEDNYIERR